jgi:hypothetical protein
MGDLDMKRLIASLLFVVLHSLTLGNAIAASDSSNPQMDDKFAIYLGGFFPEVSSKVNLNGEVLPPGDILDFESVFGLEESKTVLWGGARWQISRRNMLEFEFANLNRNGSVEGITDKIQIGDSIVQVGAGIDTTFDVTLGRLTYGFSVLKKENMELRLKAGFHIADLGVSFQATGEVCVDGTDPQNCQILTSELFETEDVTVPLPHLGGSFTYAFSPKLAARIQAIGFAIELDKIDGSLLEIDIDLVWNPWKHVGLGAGFRYFNANIESNGSKLNGEFDFEYYGPAVYGIYTF